MVGRFVAIFFKKIFLCVCVFLFSRFHSLPGPMACTTVKLLLVTFLTGVAFLVFGGVCQTAMHAIVREQILSSVCEKIFFK